MISPNTSPWLIRGRRLVQRRGAARGAVMNVKGNDTVINIVEHGPLTDSERPRIGARLLVVADDSGRVMMAPRCKQKGELGADPR
jgi:hypothetical protein